MQCSALTNEELVASLKQLVVREREAIADVIEHLAEVDARRLYSSAACSSLTTYCVEILGYSQFAAAHRVTAARLVRAYPMILPMLRSGDVNMSTLRTLAPVLTASNHQERLNAAVGRTRNEAAQSELFAEPVVEDDIHMPRAPGRATRREVAERDQYRCCYVGDDGRRCSATAWLEFDHDLDWALNGPTWAENMRLLCRAHHRAKHRCGVGQKHGEPPHRSSVGVP